MSPRFLRALTEHLKDANVSILSASVGIQLVGYGVSLLLTPLAIGFYTPQDFGKFAAVFFIANLMGSFGGLRLEWAVINEESDRAARHLVGFGYSLAFAWALVLLLTFLIVPEATLTPFGVTRLDMLWSAPIACVIGYGLFQQAYGIRMQKFSAVYTSRNVTMVARQTLQIVHGPFNTSVFGLLVSELGSRLAGNLLFARSLPERLPALPPSHFWKNINRNVVRRYGHYTKVALPSSLLNFALTEGLAVILLVLEGTEAAGSYWLVMRIFGLPIALIGNVVGDVLQGQMARQREPVQVRKKMRWAGIFLGFFSLAFLPVGALLFWWLTGWLYDGRWAVSGVMAVILVPAICLQFVASPLSRSLIVLEMMQYKFIFDGTLLITVLAWIAFRTFLKLDIYASIAVLSAAQFVSYGVYLFLSFWVARFSRRLAPVEQ